MLFDEFFNFSLNFSFNFRRSGRNCLAFEQNRKTKVNEWWGGTGKELVNDFSAYLSIDIPCKVLFAYIPLAIHFPTSLDTLLRSMANPWTQP